MLADLLDRWQATVPWFQAGEELMDPRHDGASAQVCRDRRGLPGKLAGLVKIHGCRRIPTEVVRDYVERLRREVVA